MPNQARDPLQRTARHHRQRRLPAGLRRPHPDPGPRGRATRPGAGQARRPSRPASRSTVKITGSAPACRRRIEGSGFVFAPEKVMTNAHVVAGTRGELTVEARRGQPRRPGRALRPEPRPRRPARARPRGAAVMLGRRAGRDRRRRDRRRLPAGRPVHRDRRPHPRPRQRQGPGHLRRPPRSSARSTRCTRRVLSGNSGGPLHRPVGRAARRHLRRGPRRPGHRLRRHRHRGPAGRRRAASTWTDPVGTGDCT